jgi:MFS family permease
MPASGTVASPRFAAGRRGVAGRWRFPDRRGRAARGIVGKAGWGALSDRVGRELTYTLAFGCVAASVPLLALAGVYPRTVLPYGYAVLIGIGYAVTAPLTPAIASDLFGGPRFPRIFGLLQVTNSLGGAIGAWIAGVIFDLTASYARALTIAAGMALLAPGLL